MITIQDKSKCTGCTACASICPQRCIVMEEDAEGFKYPNVNREKCIHCDRCEQVCPFNTVVLPTETITEAFVIRAKDERYLLNGTSGGFVGSLFDYVLDNDGVCCAAKMDENMCVRHVFITNKEEWENNSENIQGSKYVQSELSDSFAKIKDFLKEGRLVLFIGTPCQVNGLKNFVGENINLILIDFLCHGVPSHLLWDKYKEDKVKHYKAPIVKAQFRKKTYGYNGSTMSLEFENGQAYNGFLRTDLMLKAYYGNIGTRYSCFACPAKGNNRSSDITIFDSWHAKQLAPELIEDNRGYTNIIVHSRKGRDIWREIRERYVYYVADSKEAIMYDGIMYANDPKPADTRAEFYKVLKEQGIQKAMHELMPVTLEDRVKVMIKKFLYIGKKKRMKTWIR